MGKKIKKTVKKAVRKVTKPVEKVVKGTVGAVGDVLGGGKPETQVIEQAAPVAAPAPAAQIIEPPEKNDVDTDDDAQTESGKKKARAGGKKSLSVTRSSGGGLNI
nr:MAG TPA: virion assembly protein [Caudoviricetes sp.]